MLNGEKYASKEIQNNTLMKCFHEVLSIYYVFIYTYQRAHC